MAFFKVDDGVWGHPKFALLSNDAVALWVMAGSWCGRYMTDGLLPFQSLALVRGTKTAAEELVDAGLWDTTPSGWLFHDWDHYQYTKDEVETRRAKDREKKARERTATREALDVVSGYEPAFVEFWTAYPLKVGKRAAHTAWLRARKMVADEHIVTGAVRYRDDPNRDAEFTKHPTTWLNHGCWDDAPLPPRRGAGRSAAKVDEVQGVIARAAARDAERERKGIEG